MEFTQPCLRSLSHTRRVYATMFAPSLTLSLGSHTDTPKDADTEADTEAETNSATRRLAKLDRERN